MKKNSTIEDLLAAKEYLLAAKEYAMCDHNLLATEINRLICCGMCWGTWVEFTGINEIEV